MATVIDSQKVQKHNVQKYNFKVIGVGSSEAKTKEQTTPPAPESIEPKLKDEEIDSSALSSSSKDSLIESLMKKTDEMSSNFIKLQMKLEAKEEEFKRELEAAKQEAYARGFEEGSAQAKKETEEELNQKITLFEHSVSKLDSTAEVFSTSLEKLKSELVIAALDISKEVIKIEISQNSAEIAKVLSDELIKDLQDASSITLKVNPKDHSVVSEHLSNLKHIRVVSDSAIQEGGVVVLSDAGNIDSQIDKRFQRVKKAALSE